MSLQGLPLPLAYLLTTHLAPGRCKGEVPKAPTKSILLRCLLDSAL